MPNNSRLNRRQFLRTAAGGALAARTANPTRRATAPAIPNGAVVVGETEDGLPICLDARQRSHHVAFIGPSGTGKTTAMKVPVDQHLRASRPVIVLDAGNDLSNWTVNRYCFLKAMGYPVGELKWPDFTQDKWVFPLHFFDRRPGDLSVQVDRDVTAIAGAAWQGAVELERTPTLERILRNVVTVCFEKNLTFEEARHLLDFHSREVMKFLTTGLGTPAIEADWGELRALKSPAAWHDEILSCKNRLTRFWTSNTLRLATGVAINGLDWDDILARGQSVVLPLGASYYLSEPQARVIRNLAFTGLIDAGLRRPTGAPERAVFIDEAAKFAIPELGDGLDQLRKKGVFLNFGFQHLAQFRHDEKLFGSVKNNVGTKLVFAVRDRKDAQELSDDLVGGLSEDLQVKYVHQHLSHKIVDTRDRSYTRSRSQNTSHGTGTSETEGESQHEDFAENVSTSRQHARTLSLSRSRAENRERGLSGNTGTSTAHTQSRQHQHSEGGTHTSHSTRTETHTASSGTTETETESARLGALLWGGDAAKSKTTGSNQQSSDSLTVNSFHYDTDNWSDTETEGESVAKSDQASKGWSRSKGATKTTGITVASTDGESETEGQAATRGRATSRARTNSASEERGESQAQAITDQAGVRHEPFFEQQPEFRTLEEKRWSASETLMRQQVGQCFISIDGAAAVPARIPRPPWFYIQPAQLVQLRQQLLARHCLTREQAEQIIAERHRRLLEAARAHAEQQQDPAEPMVNSANNKSRPIWNRAAGDGSRTASIVSQPKFGTRQPLERKRGPKPDLENHAKVVTIISDYGVGWTTDDDNLSEICDKLDQAGVPVPKTWASRADGKSHSWNRALDNYRHLVVKAIKDRLKVGNRER